MESSSMEHAPVPEPKKREVGTKDNSGLLPPHVIARILELAVDMGPGTEDLSTSVDDVLYGKKRHPKEQ